MINDSECGTLIGRGDAHRLCRVLGLGNCGRQDHSPPKDVHVLIPERVNLSPYMAKGDSAA